MQVTKALIEKYHDGHCTPEEAAAVESWLDNDIADAPAGAFTNATARDAMKQQIWQQVRPVAPFYKRYLPHIAAAAAVLLFVVFRFLVAASDTPATTASNSSNPGFTIQLGKESKASFQQDTLNFHGTIKIVSTKNQDLLFHTTCKDGTTRTKAIHISEGESYIALHYKDKESSEMLVINENMLFELPPVIKNQLSEQFKI
ncbi:hypothetical protein HNQ91_005889 [Filimonas zeae]|uniref:Uncharacterized protein n=1 Tax=Filimonas zeae TaxID=1737353 RepID=A0A917J4J8_9BACT|nr:hypothetical protein [Filimonas zeae]MDR6342802.1 hypothetical protein [Filimonas zeae]GGH82765.1 hypothetical protein GCM10011379_57140 [Filimonas zeae]